MNSDAAWPIRNGPKSAQAKRSRSGNDPNAPDVLPLKKSISIRVLIFQSRLLIGVSVSNPKPGVPRSEHRVLARALRDRDGRGHEAVGAAIGRKS